MTYAHPPGDRPYQAARPVLERPGLAALLFVALSPFPLVCFSLALLTDIAYWQTSYLMWQYFSSWLLLAGLVGGGLALLVGVIAVLAHRPRYGWSYLGVDVLVLLLAFMNSLVHARDGWTAVVPWGLTLSALTVLVLVAGGLFWHASSPFRRPI
jgi:uncharacterized membrane protein